MPLKRWWKRWQTWRFERLTQRVVYQSADVMLVMAAQRLGHDLTAVEREALRSQYGAWLCADERRLRYLIEQPTWTVQRFLFEALP